MLALSVALWLGVGLRHVLRASSFPTVSACASGNWVMETSGGLPGVRCQERGPRPGQSDLRGPPALLFGKALDVNAASASDFTVIPGIGPKRAAALVEARKHARYQAVSDLRRARGIGRSTLARIQGWVAVKGVERASPSAEAERGNGASIVGEDRPAALSAIHSRASE
ncbi:MAG: helix-hairpin-helix domain-containing protein [Myxococcota bacterium]|nr:helix-hairpin-helix domain-containing protein [Myxococcota bacterium]